MSEPNCFTGDYVYCIKHPKSVLLVLKVVLYECIHRYRANRKSEPKSLKIVVSVRDCHADYKFFYSEVRELCAFIEDHCFFSGPTQVITFRKRSDSYGAGDDKPKPGTVLNMRISKFDALTFDMITHWASIDRRRKDYDGHSEYEARAAHYEVYTSSRRDPRTVPGDNASNFGPRMTEEQYLFPSDQDENVQPSVYYWPQLMHALGYFHQLVSYPTSLPTPVRIANNLSRRGVSILQHNLDEHDEILEGTEKDVLGRLSAWTYKNSTLRNQRFSA